MARSLVFIIIAIVLFLIPVVLVLIAPEGVTTKVLIICGFGGLASFAAGHLPV